jgi:hypothetical protein
METRSKVKGVPQGIPTTSFIEEVSKALPPTQGTYPTLHKQQLVEEFPESKFPLLSETTQLHVSTEELKHLVPIHNPASPKSLKPEPSASVTTLILNEYRQSSNSSVSSSWFRDNSECLLLGIV